MKKKLIIGIAVLAVIVAVVLLIKDNRLPLGWLSIKSRAERVGEEALSFINENLLSQQGITASLNKASDDGSVYKLEIKIGDRDTIVYVSKDGRYLFPEGIELKPSPSPSASPSAPPVSAKPEIKLFVMSYCPFGLQAEKAYLPVYELLKDKADFGIYFVDYIMHGKQEIDENLRQYCIQKEQTAKFSAYLDCFTKSGESASCLTQTGVNQQTMANCVAETDSAFKITELYNDETTWLSGTYPQFNVQKELNDQYNVGGSPTIVINGQEMSLAKRSPEAFKNLVCQAFETRPAECDQELSTAVSESGFGSGSGNSSGGECQ